ncbi:MAG: amidohydrolase family protein, partial [Spirochaetes bacterium]|nr:amidohydrolase family protein [Spirochaetota bacterium]
MEYSLKAKSIITPTKSIYNGEIIINNSKIKSVSSEDAKSKNQFLLKDQVIFPGLINAHDHLLGNYFPRIGDGPYINWLPWDNDLKSSPVYAERSKIPPKLIYALGSYRNIFSGVTTVSDHIPHFVNEPYINVLPIRIIGNYTLAHESSSYDLKWGEGVAIEHQKALKNNFPFITHIEEGYDDESETGIEYLLKEKALSEHTVLIHAIALSDEDIKEVSKKKANIVWCPNSNIFMFNRTGNVKKWLTQRINVSLGTDSPMSGGLHLLDELQFAKKIYKKMYNDEIDDYTLTCFVTINPAKAFRISKEVGSLEKDKNADLVAISPRSKDPYASLVNAQLKDVSLVIINGKPVYGDREFEELFKFLKVKYSKFKLDGAE